MIDKFITYVWDKCEVVSKAIAVIPYFVYATVGLVIIGGSVAAALYIPLQIASVIVASIGSILGSAICSMTLAKFISESNARAIEVREAKITALAEAKAAVEAQSEENRKAEAKNRSLSEEITRLKLMHVNADAYRPVLKLGLLECKATIHDFYRKTLKEDSASVGRDEREEYWGIVKASFVGTFGVNLEGLRFRSDGPSTVVVSGIRAENLGFTKLTKDWILKEIRNSKTGSSIPGMGDSHTFQTKHLDLADLVIEQDATLMDRIGSGIALESAEEGVGRMAQEFLKLLFSHIGKTVVFSDNENEGGLSLIEFLNKHNAEISGRIDELRLGHSSEG